MTASERAGIVAGGMVSVAEAARITGLSKSYLYGLMEQGRLAYGKFGKARRIPRNSLEQLMADALQGGGIND